MDKFFLDYKAKVDPHFSEMINAIKEENQKWLGSHETKYTIQIGTEDAETPATQYIPLPIRDSETIHTYINEPQINSGLVSPVVMPSGGV